MRSGESVVPCRKKYGPVHLHTMFLTAAILSLCVAASLLEYAGAFSFHAPLSSLGQRTMNVGQPLPQLHARRRWVAQNIICMLVSRATNGSYHQKMSCFECFSVDFPLFVPFSWPCVPASWCATAFRGRFHILQELAWRRLSQVYFPTSTSMQMIKAMFLVSFMAPCKYIRQLAWNPGENVMGESKLVALYGVCVCE